MKGLIIIMLSLLLSCSKSEWVCTCEQEKHIQDDLKRDFGDDIHHTNNNIINNYYKHKVKRYCEEREPIKDSCDVIISNFN